MPSRPNGFAMPLFVLIAACASVQTLPEDPPSTAEADADTDADADLDTDSEEAAPSGPISLDDLVVVAEGDAVRIDVTGNDTDADGDLDTTAVTVLETPLYGSLTANADGTLDYSHDGSETVADAFSYQVEDLAGNSSNPAVVHIEITPVNDLPVAVDDAEAVPEGAGVDIDLAANDSDVDDGLDFGSISVVQSPASGSVSINGDGTVTYRHDGSESLADSFLYRISDLSGGLSNVASVDVAVTPVNDAPVATDDSANVAEGAVVSIDVAANDIDPDDGLDLDSVVITSSPSFGTLTLNADGSVDYSHDGSDVWFDAFSYTIEDLGGQISNVGRVELSISAVNDPPVAVDDFDQASTGGATWVQVLANDFDVDDALVESSVLVVTPPINGAVTVNGDGTVIYAHDGSPTAADDFSYTVRDRSGATSNVAVVSMSIAAGNGTPVANDDVIEVFEGAVEVIDVAANDTDPDDGLDLGSIRVVSAPVFGSVTVNGDGTVDYAHNGVGPVSDDVFTYTIDDLFGNISNVATVDISVLATDCVQLDHLGIETQTLPFPLSGVSPATHFLLAHDYTLVPGDRVYLLADYNLKNRPWDMHWAYFLYAVDPDPQCSVNLVDSLDENVHWIDTEVHYPNGSQVPLAPLWGDGPTQGADEGINIWDLTDIVSTDADCGGQNVAEAIDLSPSFEPRFIFWDYGGAGDAVVRHFDIYIGREVPCP